MANNFLELLCAIWNVNLFECSFCDNGSFKIKKALKHHLKTFHQVGSNYYVKKKIIGNGNFGEIHVGNNFVNKEKVAIKLEPKECENPRLAIEFEFYKILGNHKGILETYAFEPFNENNCNYNALVMELLGPSLKDLFMRNQSKFSLNTVLLIANQILDILKYIHSKGLIHQDIKPENFLIGRISKKKNNVIHLIDFGLSKKFLDLESGKHIPYMEYRNTVGPGNAKYMSINTLLGKEQSRRDDLESLGYMLIHFLGGNLPWNTVTGTKQEKLKQVFKLKKTISIWKLCENCPKDFKETMVAYFMYVRSLEFDGEPNYANMKMLFTDLRKSRGYLDDEKFDWTKT